MLFFEINSHLTEVTMLEALLKQDLGDACSILNAVAVANAVPVEERSPCRIFYRRPRPRRFAVDVAGRWEAGFLFARLGKAMTCA